MDCSKIPRKSGVYIIKNVITDDFYIGSSYLMRKRLIMHRSRLRAGKHHNAYLQNSFNKYGEKYFTTECLELCDVDVLLQREEFYITNLNPQFNIIRAPSETKLQKKFNDPEYVPSGRHKAAFQCPKLREKIRQNTIEAHRRNPQQAVDHSELMKGLVLDPEYRTKQSEGTKQAMKRPEVRAKYCALTDDEVIFILQLKRDGHTNRTIAKILDKKLHTIDDVSSGKTYKHIDRETLEVDWSLVE